MHKKLKLAVFGNKTTYWLVAIILAAWAATYVYFISSSQIPARLSDYDEELHVKEHALRRTLSGSTRLNPDPADLARVYGLLGNNEVCLNDLPAAEKHMRAAMKQTESQPGIDKESMATICLQNANLCRDLNKFNLAKINYDRCLEFLHQIPLSPDFKDTALQTAALNLNNLGVLYFLMGQKTVNGSQRLKSYLTARDYFVRARDLMYALDSHKNGCFQYHINENLNCCLIEMQFSQ